MVRLRVEIENSHQQNRTFELPDAKGRRTRRVGLSGDVLHIGLCEHDEGHVSSNIANTGMVILDGAEPNNLHGFLNETGKSESSMSFVGRGSSTHAHYFDRFLSGTVLHEPVVLAPFSEPQTARARNVQVKVTWISEK